nr:hypothetical protein [uncultured Clostridium sp.]
MPTKKETKKKGTRIQKENEDFIRKKCS